MVNGGAAPYWSAATASMPFMFQLCHSYLCELTPSWRILDLVGGLLSDFGKARGSLKRGLLVAVYHTATTATGSANEENNTAT